MHNRLFLALAVMAVIVVSAAMARTYSSRSDDTGLPTSAADINAEPAAVENGFTVEILVDGRPVPEYAARGRRYIEAFENAEYELRIHNPLSIRVAVALSVDGLNTIDARHTSSWDAHKWVIEPYGTIYVRGWQMSSENARRFYFTTERESYGAKLGQTANLGVISAVFFRERRPTPITVTPGQTRLPSNDKDRASDQRQEAPAGTVGQGARKESGADEAKSRNLPSYPAPDDESAATGIGRSVRNDVEWIKLDLDPRPAGDITIRYEYRAGLVRLGIIPRDVPRQDVLDRRERAKGFEPRYCPQP